jgi:hypothetical protein
MATISTPVRAYLASPVGGTAMGQSASLTVAISVSGYEANVPFLGIQPNTTSLSAGWECYAYRSADAGATYETVASVPMSFARSPNTLDRKPLLALANPVGRRGGLDLLLPDRDHRAHHGPAERLADGHALRLPPDPPETRPGGAA